MAWPLRPCHLALTDHFKNPPEQANTVPAFTNHGLDVAAAASPEAQVSSTQALECNAVGANDVCVDRLSRGHQPGIVLAHSAFRATLQKGTPPRLGKLHPMDRKSLQ